jgi:type VI secretion system protein ImpL
MMHLLLSSVLLGWLLSFMVQAQEPPLHDGQLPEADIAQAASAFAASPRPPAQWCPPSPADQARALAFCTRAYATDQLRRISLLGDTSRLYSPDIASGAESDLLYDLGPRPVVRDYLSRQLDRARVLAGYAVPYVRYLRGSDTVVHTGDKSAALLSFWSNTIHELSRHIEHADANGAVGRLEQQISQRLTAMTEQTCREGLASESPQMLFGNDLFSERHLSLVQKTRALCDNRLGQSAHAHFGRITNRFNRELAGRYPFGPANAQDADPAIVRAFLRDYLAEREVLRTHLKELAPQRQAPMGHFLGQLDGLARFLNDASAVDGVEQGIAVRVQFRALAPYALGSDQIVDWQFHIGSQIARYPGAGTAMALRWGVGEGVHLEMRWADRSVWSPTTDDEQHDLSVDGKNAAFVHAGPWALLRFVQSHRPRALPVTLPRPLLTHWLELNVPVTNKAGHRSRARLYIGLGLDRAIPADYPLVAPS